MHQTRKSASTKLPIERKGAKYIARASSNIKNSVPVVIAVRDMLKLARTAKEVRKMIQNKLLKINGRLVKDYRESIQLFNILEADKTYELSILPTKKFIFVPITYKDLRLCKVVNKRLSKKGIFQLNLHDGSNVLTKDKINVNDAVYLDFTGKIKKHSILAKDKEAFIISGKYAGEKAKITHFENKKVSVKFKGGTAVLNAEAVAVL